MKKILLMLSMFSTLMIGCSKDDLEYDNPSGLPTPKANEIYYTTINGKFLDLSNQKWFYTDVASHTVKNDSIFVLTFVKDLEEIKYHMFNLLEWDVNDWLKSMCLPEGIKSIGEGAFWRCDNLQSINIPKSVTTIEEWAFGNAGDDNFTIYCKPITPPTLNKDIFTYYYIPPRLQILVPNASVEKYKAAEVWSKYADYIKGYDF